MIQPESSMGKLLLIFLQWKCVKTEQLWQCIVLFHVLCKPSLLKSRSHLFLGGIGFLCFDNSRFFLTPLSLIICIWGHRRRELILVTTFPRNRAHQDSPSCTTWPTQHPCYSLCPDGFKLQVTCENTTWNLFPKTLFIHLGRFLQNTSKCSTNKACPCSSPPSILK